MASRLNLHNELKEILGNNNVYFQPPESLKLNYPCIVYYLVGLDNRHADDTKYITKRRYDVTLIDRDPDSDLPEKINRIQYSNPGRFFCVNNLYHYPFTIYY